MAIYLAGTWVRNMRCKFWNAWCVGLWSDSGSIHFAWHLAFTVPLDERSWFGHRCEGSFQVIITNSLSLSCIVSFQDVNLRMIMQVCSAASSWVIPWVASTTDIPRHTCWDQVLTDTTRHELCRGYLSELEGGVSIAIWEQDNWQLRYPDTLPGEGLRCNAIAWGILVIYSAPARMIRSWESCLDILPLFSTFSCRDRSWLPTD